jgi:hypothetical protein
MPNVSVSAGVYGWAGQLELNPDPFTVWSDASDLLTPGSNSSSNNNKRRSLLQTGNGIGTGNVPVQGRVAVRETGSGSGSSSSSSSSTTTAVALDESGDIMVLGPPPVDVCLATPAACPASAAATASGKLPQTGAPAASNGSTQQSSGGLSKLQIPGLPISPKVLIIIAALALCATGFVAPRFAPATVAGVPHRKRKRQREQQQQATTPRDADEEDEPQVGQACSREDSFVGNAGSNSSRQVRRRISSTAGYGSHARSNTTSSNGSGNETASAADMQPGGCNKGRGKNPRFKKRLPGANSAPALEHSANGSPMGSPDASSGELDERTLPTQRIGSITATNVQFLELGETGFGSVCGGPVACAGSGVMPSARDSIDIQSMFEPAAAATGPRPSKQHRQQQQQQQSSSLRSSLSVMANGIKSAVNGLIRSSQAGAAYKVPKSGDAALRSSLDYPQHGMGERGPTLPGARRGSVHVPAAAAAEFAAKAAAIAAGAGVPAALQLAPAATSAQLQRTVPAKWCYQQQKLPHTLQEQLVLLLAVHLVLLLLAPSLQLLVVLALMVSAQAMHQEALSIPTHSI